VSGLPPLQEITITGRLTRVDRNRLVAVINALVGSSCTVTVREP
jgi:hypothetical protein